MASGGQIGFYSLLTTRYSLNLNPQRLAERARMKDQDNG